MTIDPTLRAASLEKPIARMFELSAQKIRSIERNWDASRGTPVFTVGGKYTTRGWTEWTKGFQFGSALLQFDATGETQFLKLARKKVLTEMATHVSHMGVHDHGFNNVSTYGNLRRLILEEKAPEAEGDLAACEIALKVSGAVQAARWTPVHGGGGYIYSFNGPHSLFIDTLRSLRSLCLAHQLGHVLMSERDSRISLLARAMQHALTTAQFGVYYGKGRDSYDVRGRTAHESIFNTNDGNYRCPNSQQGYSPFSTWTRGLAWAITGFAEQLEFARTAARKEVADSTARALLEAATATADFYIENSCACGVPLWDTGAPNLHLLGDYLAKPADPFNRWEPVDSSAGAIAAQGLLRLGQYLGNRGKKYRQAGLTVLRTLLNEPYLSTSSQHQGLLLHSVYHRPNGWDSIAKGQAVPNGESSMWGDYHLREAALLVLREIRGGPYLTFFDAD